MTLMSLDEYIVQRLIQMAAYALQFASFSSGAQQFLLSEHKYFTR